MAMMKPAVSRQDRLFGSRNHAATMLSTEFFNSLGRLQAGV